MHKPDTGAGASNDRIAALLRGPESGPLAGAVRPVSATAVGLAIAGAVPFALGIIVWSLVSLGDASETTVLGVALIASAAEIAAIVAIIRYGENRLLGSVGIRPPAAQDLKLGLGFGLGLFLLAILIPTMAMGTSSRASVGLGSHLRLLFPGFRIPATSGSFAFAILVVAITAVAEELAMRGFAASRLRTMTRSVAVGGVAALALDLAAHLPLWGFGYTIAIAPAEAILVGLFLWKRRLLPCVVANFTAGAMVLALAAVAGTRVPLSRASGLAALFGPSAPGTNAALPRGLIPPSSPLYPIVQKASDYADKGDYKHAVAEMDKAIRLDDYDAYLYSYRGRLYAAENLHDLAIADFSKAISLRPKTDDFWRYRADEYLRKRDNRSANRDYTKAIELNPRNPKNFLDRAILYQSENRNSEALSDINNAIKLSPDDATYHMRRAGIRIQMHDYKRALSDCDQIVKLYPSSGFGYGCRYDVYSASGDRSRALASLRDLLKVSPGNVKVLADKGDLELQLGQWGAAKDDFAAMAKNASRVDPDDANWAAITMATSTHPEGRDGKAALILARHACEATGYRNAQYIATLAAAYAEVGEFEQAIKWQRTAIGLESNHPRSRGFDLAVLRLYEKRRPLRANDFGPARQHRVLKEILGLIFFMLMLIGLVTVIVWGVKLSNRRRRSRAAPA